MARQIDTDVVINSIRIAEQAGDVGAIAAGYWQLYAKEGGLYLEDDNEVVGGPLGTNFVPSGRLTLTTATPVTTADVTAAATLYYTPYIGNMISLYDGARWIPVVFTEKSLSIAAFTASKPYDIFGYLSSGTLALEGLVWTNSTTRATALAYQDGRLVKNGAATRLYLGTIYVNASGGQTDDSLTKRSVFNYYNRIMRPFYLAETTEHNYSTTTWRPWNNDATQLVEYTCGMVESSMQIGFNEVQVKTSATTVLGYVQIGLDVTNNVTTGYPTIKSTLGVYTKLSSHVTVLPSLGRHFLSINEYGSAATCTFGSHYFSGFVMG